MKSPKNPLPKNPEGKNNQGSSSGNYQLILRRLDNDGKKVDRQARRKIERKERSKEGMHQAANA